MEPQCMMLSTVVVVLLQWKVLGVNRLDAAAQPNYVSNIYIYIYGNTLLSLITSRRSSDPLMFLEELFSRGVFPD